MVEWGGWVLKIAENSALFLKPSLTQLLSSKKHNGTLKYNRESRSLPNNICLKTIRNSYFIFIQQLCQYGCKARTHFCACHFNFNNYFSKGKRFSVIHFRKVTQIWPMDWSNKHVKLSSCKRSRVNFILCFS